MTAQQSIALIVLLSGLLAVSSALAGVLWQRNRTLREQANLGRLLDIRLRALEGRLEALGTPEAASKAIEAPMPPMNQVVRVDVPVLEARLKGPTLIAVPDLAAPAVEAAPLSPDLASRFQSIWRLAAEGTPPEAIARATGQPVGQVELILALRRHLPPYLVEAPV